MKCSELMRRDVECASVDECVADVAESMRDRNIGFLPVCNDRGEVIGAITDRDLAVRVVAERLPIETTTVRDVMTSDIVACRPSDELDEAERQMSEHKKSRIVCVDERNHAVGVISLSDIAATGDKGALSVLSSVAQREASL